MATTVEEMIEMILEAVADAPGCLSVYETGPDYVVLGVQVDAMVPVFAGLLEAGLQCRISDLLECEHGVLDTAIIVIDADADTVAFAIVGAFPVIGGAA